jgi:hypothetical protein
MVWPWSKPEGTGMSLTYEERREFNRLDEKVSLAAAASKVVMEGGAALATIRDRQLYREVAGTWEEYLQRHGLTRRRADQIVQAATVFKAVSVAVEAQIGTAVPELSERAMRPLVSLPTDEAAQVVIAAAGEPEGITPATIRKAATRRARMKAKVSRPWRLKVPGAVVIVTFNRKGSGSAVEALAAALKAAREQAGQADAA